MATISILQKHKLPHKKARAAAQKVADQMAKEYDVESKWGGDVLNFRRSGVTGTLMVYETEAQLEIRVGFLLSTFAPTIEEHLTKNMKKVFGGKA